MAVPAQLRAIQHHLRTAQEHEKRDPVVSYYCRLYAMQTGMKQDNKTPECRKFLIKLMDQLESMKKELSDNDSITQEVVGNAHIENYALKMFLYADNEDRAGRFHKNMIKSFYTASLLLDVLSVFGELSEENIQHRKYARWKAAYIHNCLKNGETPEAGPIGMDLDQEADGDEGFSGQFSHGGSFRGEGGASYQDPGQAFSQGGSFRGGGGATSQDPGQGFSPSGSFRGGASAQDPSVGGPTGPSIGFTGVGESGPSGPASNFSNVHIPPGAHAPANTPADAVKPVPMPRTAHAVDPNILNSQQQQGDVHLSAEDFTKAQKYCKYAGSALQYEDVPTAIHNLQKALKLLTTGEE